MSENWKTYKLEDALEALIDYRGKTPKKTTEGVPLVTAKIVKQGRIQEPNEFIAKEDYKSWMSRGIPNVGDVVLTTEAPLGEVAQISDANIALAQRIVTLRGKVGVLDNGYLKYYLLSNKGQARLAARQSGTTVFGIKQSELRKVEIDCPTYEEQRSISNILSAIDDKIELNLQMNKTLEEMATTLYKHWFVDFGPFQDGGFVDSELGMIPKGWEVKLLQELGKMFYGQMPKKELIVGEGYPIYSGYRNVGYYQNYNCDKGKVIVVARGVGGTGDIKLTSEKCFLTNLSICFGNDIGLIDDSLLFFGLKRYGLDHLRTGSAQPQITINDLNRVEILVPPKDIQSQFLQIFSSLLDEMESHTIENQILTSLRDTLLPKLISGEVRVKEAEEALADVL